MIKKRNYLEGETPGQIDRGKRERERGREHREGKGEGEREYNFTIEKLRKGESCDRCE